MDLRVARCLLLSKVLLADGIITQNERTVLERAMDKHELDDTQRQNVLALEGWGEAESALIALSDEKKRELVAELLDAASVDGRLTPLEAAMVKQISERLGVG